MLGESIDPRLLRLDPQVFKSIESAGAAYGDMYESLGKTGAMTLDKIQKNQKTEEMYQSLLSAVDPIAESMDVNPTITKADMASKRYDWDALVNYDLPSALESQKQRGREKIQKFEAVANKEEREDLQDFEWNLNTKNQWNKKDIMNLANDLQTIRDTEKYRHEIHVLKKKLKGEGKLVEQEKGLDAQEALLVRNFTKATNEWKSQTDLQTSEHLLVVKAWLEMEIDASEAAISVSKTSDMNEEARNHMQELANVKWAIEDKLIERHGETVRGLNKRYREIPKIPVADMTDKQRDDLQVLQREYAENNLGMPRNIQRFDTEKELGDAILSGRLVVDDMLTPEMRRVIKEDRMGLLVGKPGAIALGTLQLGLRNLLEPPTQPSTFIGSAEEYKEKWNQDKVDDIYKALGIKEADQTWINRQYNEVLQSVGKLPFWNEEGLEVKEFENVIKNFGRKFNIPIGEDFGLEGKEGEINVDERSGDENVAIPLDEQIWDWGKGHFRKSFRNLTGLREEE